MLAVKRALVSEEEFLSLPESTDKVELLDGEVIVSPSPLYWHQEVLGRVYEALRAWARTHRPPFTVAMAPIDVRFGPDRILQPDVVVFSGRLPRDQATPIDRVPVLCVEVLSSDRLYDRVTKRMVYAAAGVAEYWVVEPMGPVEVWSGPGLTRSTDATDTLRSPHLPDLSIDVAALFAE